MTVLVNHIIDRAVVLVNHIIDRAVVLVNHITEMGSGLGLMTSQTGQWSWFNDITDGAVVLV